MWVLLWVRFCLLEVRSSLIYIFLSFWGVLVDGFCFCVGFAGVAQWSVSIPSDVIKSRIQSTITTAMDGSDRVPRSRGGVGVGGGFLATCVRTVRHEGVSVLFRGWAPAVLTAFPVNAVALVARAMALKAMHQLL
jgi:solute carrier family 25 (mitochondrial carnitine/acylcarnitine transporter), member 20/29